MVSVPKLVTPRRLSLVLLVVYLVYMVAMYLKDLNEEKEDAKVETVVNSVAIVNTTGNGKETSLVLLLNDEGVSKVDAKEGTGGEDKGEEDKGEEGEGKGEKEGKSEGGGDKGGEGGREYQGGEEGGKSGVKEDKTGGGKKELGVGGELSSAMVDPPRKDSWLRNRTEVRLWIGENLKK